MGAASSAAAVKGSDKQESEVSRRMSKQQNTHQFMKMDENGASDGRSDTLSTCNRASDGNRETDNINPDEPTVTNERTAANEPVGGIEASKDDANEPEEAKDAKDEDKDETEKKKEQPPLTREEIEMLKTEILTIMETHVNAMKDKEWTDEEGKYTQEARKALYGFSVSYFALKNATLADMIESRRQIAQVVLTSDVLTKVCGAVIDVYPKGWANEEKKTDLAVWRPFSCAFLFILNYSDASHDFAVRVANTPGFLEMIRRILAESIEAHLKQDQPINREKVMKWALSIVHNISMVEANIPRLRSLNFTEVLEPYLESPNKMYQLNCLASLAGIIDEKESEILNTKSSSVKFLMTVLKKGLASATRRYNGWSSKECALTVKLLARNDTNKKLLVELGALELLVELAKGSIEEQIEAVGAIWALSFDEENRKVMVGNEELGVVSTLLNLKAVDNDKIKAAANGTLWNLRKELEKTETFHELGENLSNGRHRRKKSAMAHGRFAVKEEESDQEEAGHIMISYQWANQKTLIEVRDSLIDNGFKVWMDIDQMGGSTLQAMADAVENANIVLIAMSQKYKDSPNCRAEAEYAFQQRKKIVPLMLERGYKPDGWLGFILGAKLFYDFSGKYPFQAKFNDLLKELWRIKGQSQGVPNETIVPKKAEVNYHQPQPQVVDMTDSYHPVTIATTGVVKVASDVRKWTADDVKNWLNKNDLPVQKFGHLTAGEIALLIKMNKEAPDSFYICLKEIVKVTDLLTMSKLVWALEDIDQ